MAQFPLHIITGIYSGELFDADRPMKQALIIGNFAPDMDFIPLLAVYCFNPDLAKSFHRSASHTLFLPAFFLLLSFILYFINRKKNIIKFLIGISIGLITHILFDVLFWFDHVTLLWPLNFWNIDTTVSIWAAVNIPDVIRMIAARASEFFFYGVLFYYFGYFNRKTAELVKKEKNRITFTRLTFLSFFMFMIYAGLSFTLTPRVYDVAVYSITSFFFAPLSLYFLWRIRNCIIEPGKK